MLTEPLKSTSHSGMHELAVCIPPSCILATYPLGRGPHVRRAHRTSNLGCLQPWTHLSIASTFGREEGAQKCRHNRATRNHQRTHHHHRASHPSQPKPPDPDQYHVAPAPLRPASPAADAARAAPPACTARGRARFASVPRRDEHRGQVVAARVRRDGQGGQLPPARRVLRGRRELY